MAFLEIDGILNGRRLRKCSPTAHWRYGYYLLLSNGYSRIEMDFESISYRLVSFRGTAPTPQEIEAEFVEYEKHHLVFVYEHNGRKWAQFDTPNSGSKEWKTAVDLKSPMPPEPRYSEWLTEQHGDQWKKFHWYNPAHKTKGIRQVPTWPKSTIDQNLAKSQPSDDQDSALGLGSGLGIGKNTKEKPSKPSARKARGPKTTDIRYHHFVDILHRYWDKFTKPKIRFELWFDRAGGKQLKNILARHSTMTVEDFTHCVANRARSPGVKHEEPFYLWGGHILEWVGGPKGNGQVSKDAERNARNKAEIIRGITGQNPSGNAVHSGPAVPERDHGGSDRVLEVVADRSRAAVAGTDT